MYKPSILEMKGMGLKFSYIYSEALCDNNHLFLFKNLTKAERDSIFVFIMNQKSDFEDKRK
ncbi:hypothetical protein DCM91_20785 [Chitinophaga costaii]|nr:hypothetical protein DCM91_20785 [Chitinophaga costaii]